LNNEIILLIGIATSLAFIINLYLTPILIYLSHKHGLFDKTDYRKIHTEDTSRLGGIGIYASFLISTIISPLLVSLIIDNSVILENSELNIILLIFSTVIIFSTGVLDDFAEMRARYKLLGQIIASIIAIIGGATISSIQIPFTETVIQLGYFSIPLTIIWIIGITNALNLIDGIDGLSSGISIIAAMIYGFVFLLHGQYLPAIISYALVGSLFGYLFFNFPPARIFMGDSGSLLLGFILSILPLVAFPTSGTSLILPLTLLSIPILDVVSAIWRRTRDGNNIFSPDRFHVHHKLMDMGLNNRNILAVIYGLCLFLGIITIVFESTDSKYFLLIIIAWLVISLFFVYLHYKKKDHK